MVRLFSLCVIPLDLFFSSQEMEEVEKLKTVNANLEQRKEELVKELEQVTNV